MKVSIAMCTFNGAPFLGEQLDSLLAQDRLPDEVVICDDGSTDETVQMLEKFSRAVPFRVSLSINQANLGVIKNFEQAITACTGDVIFLCDQDDVWRADKIATLAGAFESNPRVGLVMSDAELVDCALASTGKRLFSELGFGLRMQKLAASGKRFDLFLKRNYFCGATMAFRSAFKRLIRPMPDRGPFIHDGWIGLMITAVADVVFISQTLVKYRQHPAQQVGLAQVSTLEQVMRAQRTDRKFYTAQAAQLSEALTRLIDYGIDERNEQMLREKIEHLNERARLPESQLQRIRPVGKEVVSRRYHRFSEGWLSAAKDLIH